ncbi:MAG: helix-turn-helix transcriptional regulator [Nitratireductor sp.]|nr:helix-turn-helix transcriptional regulator [Nitratireductor sp.]
MARPKKSTPTDPGSLAAEAFRALAHPSRLEIIRHLARRDHCCAGDFCCCMPIAQSTISQHLEILKAAGIVEWQAVGTKSIFTLNRARLAELGDTLTALTRADDGLRDPAPFEANEKASS